MPIPKGLPSSFAKHVSLLFSLLRCSDSSGRTLTLTYIRQSKWLSGKLGKKRYSVLQIDSPRYSRRLQQTMAVSLTVSQPRGKGSQWKAEQLNTKVPSQRHVICGSSTRDRRSYTELVQQPSPEDSWLPYSITCFLHRKPCCCLTSLYTVKWCIRYCHFGTFALPQSLC